MLLGAQTDNLKGRLVVYRSNDLKQWDFEAIYGNEMGDFGYMWECPDLFELNDQTFAIVGPQGIKSFSKHNTIPHHNGVAKVEWGSESGLTLSEFEHLDFGFDFYAPQTMLTPDGRRVMCGWMGLPDEVDQPSTDNGWVHQLTAIREITFEQGKLKQWPISELESLVESSQTVCLNSEGIDCGTKQFDLSLELEWGQTLHLFENSEQKVLVSADEQSRTLVLDRSQTLNRAQDTLRELPLESNKIALRILADNSSLEIFVNQGEAVMTSRAFTDLNATRMSLHGGSVQAEIKLLKPSSEPFV
jgi:beta-fructofuranosidase